MWIEDPVKHREIKVTRAIDLNAGSASGPRAADRKGAK
jgi:hypothetical protein